MSAGITQACENWRPIEHWPYEVSDLGRVRSSRSLFGFQPRSFVAVYSKGQRYPSVLLYRVTGRGRERWQIRVHELVASAFLGPRPEGYEINHKDLDKHNPRAENLEYVTSTENKLHAVETGAWPIGEHRWNATLTEEKVRLIWRLAGAGLSRAEIIARVGASESAVGHVLGRRNWKHLAPPEVSLA